MDYSIDIYLNFVDEDNVFYMEKVSEWKRLNPKEPDKIYNFGLWLFANSMINLDSYGIIMNRFNRTIEKISKFKEFNMIALATVPAPAPL